MAIMMTMISADKYQRISTKKMKKKVRIGRRRLKLTRIKLKKLCAIRRLLRSWRSLTEALRSLSFFKLCNASCDSDSWPSKDHHRRRHCSYGRSNSFYAEAIAECLEFIKRSSNTSDSHSPRRLL